MSRLSVKFSYVYLIGLVVRDHVLKEHTSPGQVNTKYSTYNSITTLYHMITQHISCTCAKTNTLHTKQGNLSGLFQWKGTVDGTIFSLKEGPFAKFYPPQNYPRGLLF